jgi:putative aldouronate transport system permease protein
MDVIRRTPGGRIFDFLNISFFALMAFIMIFPLWNVLVTSLVSSGEFYARPLILWPAKFDFTSYKFVLSGGEIKQALVVTVSLALIGSFYSMLCTTLLAYALSKKYLPGRNFFLILIMVTMFFGGGLIPYYLLIKNLNLINTFWVLFVPGGISTWNFLVIKSFFSQLPAELEESARIDGASDLLVFFKIVLPLSLPVLATFALFYGVGYWNAWYNALLFIQNSKLYPLQLVLRRMVVQNVRPAAMDAQARSQGVKAGTLFDEGIKMATVVVATVPILCAYPFLQKYFAKGVMIGSIKG